MKFIMKCSFTNIKLSIFLSHSILPIVCQVYIYICKYVYSIGTYLWKVLNWMKQDNYCYYYDESVRTQYTGVWKNVCNYIIPRNTAGIACSANIWCFNTYKYSVRCRYYELSCRFDYTRISCCCSLVYSIIKIIILQVSITNTVAGVYIRAF